MHDESIDADVFHYAEQLVKKNGSIMMGIGAVTVFAGLNAMMLIFQHSASSAILMVLSACVLPFAYRWWFRNFFRLAHFKIGLSADHRVSEVCIAPLNDAARFEVVPRYCVSQPDEPAPASLREAFEELSMAFPELRERLEACLGAHKQLTRYDAVNLLLIQEGLRAAKTPQYAYRIEKPVDEIAREAQRSPTPRI